MTGSDPIPPSAGGLPSLPLRVAALAARKPTRFAFRPSEPERAVMAAALELIGLPAFTFIGELTPEGRHDYRLTAELVADVVQPCSITLAPVPASLRESVRRQYLSDYREPETEEAEMVSDEAEPLPEVIDIAAVAIEALALALPPYPRAPGAELGEAVFAEPGVEPLRQADLNPFASLAAKLKERSEGGA